MNLIHFSLICYRINKDWILNLYSCRNLLIFNPSYSQTQKCYKIEIGKSWYGSKYKLHKTSNVLFSTEINFTRIEYNWYTFFLHPQSTKIPLPCLPTFINQAKYFSTFSTSSTLPIYRGTRWWIYSNNTKANENNKLESNPDHNSHLTLC